MATFSTRDKTEFFLGDLDVYIDDDVNPSAYTRAEKPVGYTAEFAEFLAGIPQALVRKDLVRFGLIVTVEPMQWTGKWMQLARGGELVTSDPDWDRLYYGEETEEAPVHKFTFQGKLRNGNTVRLIIPQGKATDYGELTTGGTDYVGLPMGVEAQIDESESNVKRNLAYWEFQKTSS